MVANKVSYDGIKNVVDEARVQGCAARCIFQEDCGAFAFDTTAVNKRCTLFLDIVTDAPMLPGLLVYRRSFLSSVSQIVKLPLPDKDIYPDHLAKCRAFGLTLTPAPSNVLDRTIIQSQGKVLLDLLTPSDSLDLINTAGQEVNNSYLRFYNFPTSTGTRYCFVNNYKDIFYIHCDSYVTTVSNTLCVTP
ncbi:hypothetical protein FHG87_001176 [Trinorchestia longiramus]|nr:hypothetical protein FHG87_001176 [Trinorchestia longiramus]